MTTTTTTIPPLVAFLRNMDDFISRPIFELRLPYAVEVFLSIPGNWFGLPMFTVLGPLCLAILSERNNDDDDDDHHDDHHHHEKYDEYERDRINILHRVAMMECLALLFAWAFFLSGRRTVMTRLLFSHGAFAVGPLLGWGILFLATNKKMIESNEEIIKYGKRLDDRAFQMGAHHLVLYSFSLVPVMLLKHHVPRTRPCIHSPHIIEKRRLRIIPRLLAHMGPETAFPSGDAAAAMAFAIPLRNSLLSSSSSSLPSLGGWPMFTTKTTATVAGLVVVFVSCFGRMYFLAHHFLDTVVGVVITFACHVFLSAFCGIDSTPESTNEDQDQPSETQILWWHPLAAHLAFVIVGLLRKSNQK